MPSASPLQEHVQRFVDEVSLKLVDATRGIDSIDRAKFPGDVANEAYAICRAMVDSDGRHSDDELWPIITTFALLLEDETLAAATPDKLRNTDLIAGAAHFFDQPSDLFEILVAGDRRNGENSAATYYTCAMDIAHAIAALDVMTTEGELEAIARFRRLLTDRIHAAGIAPSTTGVRDEALMNRESVGPSAVPAATAQNQSAVISTAQPAEEKPQTPPRPLEELLADLDALIGLSEVKGEIKHVADLLRVSQMRAEHGLPVIERSNHLIFTGNPGTGKTTVARLLAQIYRTLGVAATDRMIEVDRSGLVAGFVGQTAPLVESQFDKADQGILFIDEAYSLVRGGANDFGKEAIDAIVKNVEDRRDRIVVIMAGYTEEMNELMDANPGLRSRFPKSIHFPDYTTDELIEIFRGICKKNQYTISPEALVKLRAIIEVIPRDRHFGNGRLIRNVFEDALIRQASRLVAISTPTTEMLSTFEADDIADAAPGHAAPGHAAPSATPAFNGQMPAPVPSPALSTAGHPNLDGGHADPAPGGQTTDSGSGTP